MTKEQERLQDLTDKAITELVYPKLELQKAYDYYAGKLRTEDYRYLEENCGIGNATKVEFIPLIKKHVDALIGEYLGTPILPKVSCKDSRTISNIERDKQLKITEEVFKFLKGKLKNSILGFMDGKDIVDHDIEQQLNKLIEDINTNFISEYEIAAQNVIEYIMQSRSTDIINKLRHLLLDILITGYSFYKVKSTPNKNNVEIEVLNPLNTFIDRNPNSPYVRDSYRVVCRKWMTKSQILNEYGRELSKEDLKTIEDEWTVSMQDYSSHYIVNIPHNGLPATNGILAGQEVVPGYPTDFQFDRYAKFIPVYEVEWLETDKDFVMFRYKTVRIGESIYILHGKDEDVRRSIDNPSYCGLSVNGIYFLNRTEQPYSLVLACAPLQMRYNVLFFLRDSIIANSGTVGEFLDVSLLPSFLGGDLTERIQKWMAYRKAGTAFLDSSQEGRVGNGQAPLNTIFNGYDDSIKGQTIQAFQMAIQSIEDTCSSITGVFRERLNGIEQRDAVTNIKQGVNNSFIVTKQYFVQMDLITNEILLDALNEAKVVYKNGLTGTIVLGEKYQRIFTALPEHFTLSDYDIHITTSTDVMKDMEQIKAVIPDFIRSGSLAPDIIFEALTCKSLSDLKYKVQKAMAKQKEENNQIQQLTQQGQQMEQQLKEAQKQLQEAQNKIQQLNEAKMQLEQQKLKMDTEIAWYKAKTERTWKDREMDNDQKRVDVEIMQLHDGNPYNDKVRQYE